MKICIESTGTYPAVKVVQDADPVPNGYDEVTDIPGIAKHGIYGIDVSTPGWYDKKCVREKLKDAVYAKMGVVVPADVEDQAKWNLLTAEEKSIAVHWFIVGKEEFQNEVRNDDRYWSCEAQKYRDWTTKVRLKRLQIMEAIVFRRVNDLAYAKGILADLTQIMKDTVIDIDDISNKLVNRVRAKGLAKMYVEGLESQADDGVIAIVDFIDETAATPFESGGGFRGLDVAKFRTGHTPATVADELLKVIRNEW